MTCQTRRVFCRLSAPRHSAEGELKEEEERWHRHAAKCNKQASVNSLRKTNTF